MTIEDKIWNEVRSLLQTSGAGIPTGLNRSTPIVDTGLDSIEFAMLVAHLEDALGFDPFVALESAVYPRTMGEFIEIYEHHQA